MKTTLMQIGSAACLAALVLLPSQPIRAQQPVAASAARAGGDGIKIHGHWVIDIKNPDGSVARHLDFENSLTTGAASGADVQHTGDQVIAALLSGTAVAGDPGIGIIEFPGGASTLPAGTDDTALCTTKHTAYTCGLITNSTSYEDGYSYALPVQTGLMAQVNFSPVVNWVLTGNFTVPATGWTSVSMVQTELPICGTNAAVVPTGGGYFSGSSGDRTAMVAPSACYLGSTGSFYSSFGTLTETILPGAPVTVAPNQVLSITVTISFS